MKKSKKLFACFTDVHSVVAMALFIALSIIFGKFLAFNLTSSLRISFENLPIIVAAVAYGPIAGAVVAATADLIGCVMVGYTINPIITMGAVTIGLVAGTLSQINCNKFAKSIITVLPAHIFGSVVIKTIGLYVYFKLPFWLTFASRAGIYAVTAIAEIIIIYILLSQKIIQKFGGLRKK